MVGKSVKSSSRASAQEILSQVMASRLSSRSQRLPANKGASTCKHAKHDSSEGLSDIDDAEVVGYLNNKQEFLLKKIAWELMNGNYMKGRRKTHATSKKKTAAKKTTETTTARTTETEKKKSLSSKINYDALEELFNSEEFAQKAKPDSPDAAPDNNTDSEQSRCEAQSSDNYYGEDGYGDEEYNGGLDFENEDGGDDYGYNDYYDDEGF